MEEKNSIEVLEKLSAGMFCCIELPLTNSIYYSQVNKFNNIEKSYLNYLLKNVVPYND